MYKVRRIENGVEIFDGLNYYTKTRMTRTTWEIIQAIKKYGKQKAIKQIMKKYEIDEKNAKEDIETVLANLKVLKLDIKEIPNSVSNVKYAPRTIHFDITTKCNSKCIYCLASNRMKESQDMSTKQVLDIINQLPELGTWLLCISGGEPMMRKDIFDVLDCVEKNKILTQLFTNGILLTDKTAERLSKYKYLFYQVSLDSCIPEHHDANRGLKGAYDKTMKGIQNLLNNNIVPEICMVLTRENYKDLDESAEFLRNLGIRYVRIGPAHPYDGKGYENREKIELNTKQWSEIGKKLIKLNEKYKGKMQFLPTRHFVVYTIEPGFKEKIRKCANGRNILYIKQNGLVYPCIFSVFPEFVTGDVKKESLSHIWKTSNLIKRIRYLTVEDIEKCKTCDVNHICNGGCRASAYYHNGSLFSHDPVFCDFFGK